MREKKKKPTNKHIEMFEYENVYVRLVCGTNQTNERTLQTVKYGRLQAFQRHRTGQENENC